MVKTVMVIAEHLIYGGTEKYTLNLVNALVEKGISVILVTGGGPLSEYVLPQVKIFTLPISRNPKIKRLSEKKILKLARIYRPRVIHAQCRTALVCAQLAREYLNIPTIAHEHHLYDQPEYRLAVHELQNYADKVITTGPFAAKALVKGGLNKDKIITILNGIDINRITPITEDERKEARKAFNFSKLDKIIVCVSRIEPGKGIDKLARAFVSIAKRVPEVKLIVVGDDLWNLVKPMMKELITVNSLQDKFFIFSGEYNIRKYHAAADIFCYPAIGKGMAVMEAMAAGLPVVAQKTVRKPLVLEHNISGLMTESTAHYKIDPDQIAGKIIYLLKKPRLIKRMGKAARKRIEKKFTLDNTIKQTLAVYQEVLQANKAVQETSAVYINQ